MVSGGISCGMGATRGPHIGVAGFVPDVTAHLRAIKASGLNDFAVYFLSHFTTPF